MAKSSATYAAEIRNRAQPCSIDTASPPETAPDGNKNRAKRPAGLQSRVSDQSRVLYDSQSVYSAPTSWPYNPRGRTMNQSAAAVRRGAAITSNSGMRRVIFASSLGTVFEWYDFYLYGSLAAVIAKQFFSGLNETSAYIAALLAFAAGFFVRPFGALVFGRLGDLVGRKYTFLITIVIMGLSTFLVGVLPGYASIGGAAPAILIGLRLLQGLALGGEYGGAATYVAEHSTDDNRGYNTSFIQITATGGLFLSLLVILACRLSLKEQFDVWGWRIPFLVSSLLLGISVYIRLQLNESPLFQQMK